MTSKHRLPTRPSHRLTLWLAVPLVAAVGLVGVRVASAGEGDTGSEDGAITLAGHAEPARVDVTTSSAVARSSTSTAVTAVRRSSHHSHRSWRSHPTRSRPRTTPPTVTGPTVTLPTATRPTVTGPTVTLPTVTRPTVSVPTTTLPTKSLPTSSTTKTSSSTTTVPSSSTTKTTTTSATVKPTSSSTVTKTTTTTTTNSSSSSASSLPPQTGGSFADQVVALTNSERAAVGCRPLTVDATLTRVAAAHSQDMATRGYFDHANPEGQSPFDRMSAAGYRYRLAAENIAAGQATPQAVVSAWMNSQGHRQNILNCGLTQIGVGYATGGPFRTYWTQDFGTPM